MTTPGPLVHPEALTMPALQQQYLTDPGGQRHSVVLPLAEFDALRSQAEVPEDIQAAAASLFGSGK